MGSDLRYHRKSSGLSQKELAEVVGAVGRRQVARHEHSTACPSFIVALGYHIALGVNIAELFPGIYETVLQNIEMSLSELENRLEQTAPKGRKLEETAVKLLWLKERRKALTTHPNDED